MNERRIVAYSLLAHINNELSNKGIKDLSEIFVPLIKRVISIIYQDGVDKGKIQDIKDMVDQNYALDIPYPILVKIIKKIASEANQDQDNVFIFYQDHAFMIKKFIFTEYEEFIDKQDAEIKFLSDEYTKYICSQEIDPGNQPTLFEFLDRNRISLSNFFATKEIAYSDSANLLQANFINLVKSNDFLYSILKRIYLGSIIAAYFEADYDKMREQQLEFLLDTNFIISMIDLGSLEGYHTCLKIIELSRKNNFGLKVLNFTVQETKALLERRASELNDIRIFEELDTSTIFSACARERLNKTDLQKIAANLEKTLRGYGIHIITDKNYLVEKAKASDILKIIQTRRTNPAGALHDTTAILYIQEKRGREIKNFEDANSWFVVDSRHDRSRYSKGKQVFSELIRAEDLVNILWLSTPNVDFVKMADVGLTQLISATLSHSLPSSIVLKELDQNIQKYALAELGPEDFHRVAQSVADKTLSNLEAEELNRIAKVSPAEFINKLKEYSERFEIERKKKEAARNAMIDRLKMDWEKQVKEKEEELNKKFSSEIERGKDNLTKEKENRLKEREKEYANFDKIKAALDQKAKKQTDNEFWLFVLFYFCLFALLVLIHFIKGWNKIAPLLAYSGFVLLFFNFIYFSITKKTFNPMSFYRNCIIRNKAKIYKESNFDCEYMENLEIEIRNLKKELSS